MNTNLDDQHVDAEVRDNPAADRYELLHDGALVGVVEYRIDGDVFVIPHVEVAPALRGHGHSAPFLDAVLDDLSARGKKVRPRCGYAASHMRDQPEWAHLLA
jgi:uncharacterized protein